MKSLRIVFMGTPEFAVASLQALVNSMHKVVAVVTAPDKPAGRGKEIQMSAVKKYALTENIPVLQPEKLKSPDFIDQLKSFEADVQVVVAFRMLPEVVWKMPSLGTFNLHASLLPQLRGAAPINYALIHGLSKTGITTFFLDDKIDTGGIIMRRELEILEEDNVGSVYEKLMQMGSVLVVDTVDAIANETVSIRPQSDFYSEDERLLPAPKIFKEDCKIDWNKSAHEIHNLVRGLSPYPAAFTTIQNSENKEFQLKIFKTSVLNQKSDKNILCNQKDILAFHCNDFYLQIHELQLEGKKRMTTEEFLRGFRVKN